MQALYYSGFDFDKEYKYFKQKPGQYICIEQDASKHSYSFYEYISSVKYIRLISDKLNKDEIILTDKLEYLHLHLSLSNLFENNILDYIKLPLSVKSISILIDDDCNFTMNSNSDQTLDPINILLTNNVFIIPKNIEYLRINFQMPNISDYTALKVLVLDASQNTEFNYPLDNLPISLEWLEIHSLQYNQPLNNLPPNLKVLIFAHNRLSNYYDGYKHALDFLPIGLEILHFPECCALNGNLYLATCANLPETLKILRLPYYIPLDIDCLPNSIEVLEWTSFRIYYKDITRFPKNLKKIKCFVHNIYEKEIITKYFENMHFKIECNF